MEMKAQVLQQSESCISNLGRFGDILNDMECPASLQPMFGNAGGAVMIGHYVGLPRRSNSLQRTFLFFFSSVPTSKT